MVIVHDYLTQRGGGERVALRILEAFPGARFVTSLYEPQATFPEFANYDIETFGLNKSSWLRRDCRRALPFLAHAFSRHEITDADVVICSTSGWAHGVRTTAPKIAYCYNPPRWLYQPEDYFIDQGKLVRRAFLAARPYLLRADRTAASSVNKYVAISTPVAARIEGAYGVRPLLLHPPYGVDVDGPEESVPGIQSGFLLTLARKRGYKNVEAICQAAAQTGRRLVVVGGLPRESAAWSSHVDVLRDLPDAQIRWLYKNCVAVVAASYEDFGLTPIEGHAFGKPAIALQAGGYVDTVKSGVNGLFFRESTPAAIAAALEVLDSTAFDPEVIRDGAKAFSLEQFRHQLRTCVESVIQ